MADNGLTVAQVILEATAGEKIEGLVLHKHPHHVDKWYPANVGRESRKKEEQNFPPDFFGRVLSWEEIEPCFRYPEMFAATVSFTLQTDLAVYEHIWGPRSAGLNCGGQMVRFHRVCRDISMAKNPYEELFQPAMGELWHPRT